MVSPRTPLNGVINSAFIIYNVLRIFVEVDSRKTASLFYKINEEDYDDRI